MPAAAAAAWTCPIEVATQTVKRLGTSLSGSVQVPGQLRAVSTAVLLPRAKGTAGCPELRVPVYHSISASDSPDRV